MTKTLTLRSLDIPQLSKFGIGFDNMLDELFRINQHQTGNYPPHNVIKTGEDTLTIEVAIAGFSEGELTINLDNRILTIEGVKVREEIVNYEYLHRGISNRDFKQSYTIAEHVEIVRASIKNGILSIFLERRIPEEKKPKQIPISYDS